MPAGRVIGAPCRSGNSKGGLRTNISNAQKIQSRLKLRHLRVVAAIGEFSNIRAAAEYLGISQPAVSRTLKELEDDIGLQLVHRTNRGVVLNEYGEALRRNARQVLSQVRRTSEELSDLSSGFGGHLRIGVLTANVSPLASRVIGQLFEEHPGSTVAVVEGSNDVLMPSLIQGDLDVIVGRLPNSYNRKFVTQEALYVEKEVFIARAGHPLLDVADLGLADTVNWKWILPRPETEMRQRIDAAFHAEGLELPNCVLESVSRVINRDLIRSSDMIGISGWSAVREHIEAGVLAELPIRIELSSQVIGFSSRKVEEPSKILSNFVALLREEAARHGQAAAPSRA